jgi:Fungal specific transcription factor domain
MLDITECRDIISLQAILFMILFLQSSSNLSTCYSYIGVALRSAVRMGMHRNLTGNFNPIERETRRRVFWIIRKMDTYVAALLGFPKMLSEDDIDQELPIEVDDEYITKDAILQMPPGKLSVYTACNAHTRLMGILAKVITYIYPTRGVEQSVQPTSSPTYGISHAKIREIEGDLREWLDKLPMTLRPSDDASEDVVRYVNCNIPASVSTDYDVEFSNF